MKIYCHSCRVSHYFTEGEAEKLIYVLQAEHLEARGATAEDTGYEEYDCIRATLGDAYDSEVYLEHVEAMVGRRQQTVMETAAVDVKWADPDAAEGEGQ